VDTTSATTVISEIEARWGSACSDCGVPMIGHDIVLSLLTGRKAAPCCIGCLAREVGREPTEHLRLAAEHVRRLDCYRAGWAHSEARLRAQDGWPHPRVPATITMPPDDLDDTDEDGEREEPAVANDAEHAAAFDAGDMACGDLVLELRNVLRALAPGAVLRVRATDSGAPRDLPAWCRITRNQMVRAAHPLYWIRRSEDPTSSGHPTTKR
jgi:tRNA 2-thiouridine synthesizing protein A